MALSYFPAPSSLTAALSAYSNAAAGAVGTIVQCPN